MVQITPNKHRSSSLELLYHPYSSLLPIASFCPPPPELPAGPSPLSTFSSLNLAKEIYKNADIPAKLSVPFSFPTAFPPEEQKETIVKKRKPPVAFYYSSLLHLTRTAPLTATLNNFYKTNHLNFTYNASLPYPRKLKNYLVLFINKAWFLRHQYSKIDSSTSPNCPRCEDGTPETYKHAISCPWIQKVVKAVKETLSIERKYWPSGPRDLILFERTLSLPEVILRLEITASQTLSLEVVAAGQLSSILSELKTHLKPLLPPVLPPSPPPCPPPSSSPSPCPPPSLFPSPRND